MTIYEIGMAASVLAAVAGIVFASVTAYKSSSVSKELEVKDSKHNNDNKRNDDDETEHQQHEHT